MEIARALICSYVFSWIYILSSIPLTLSYRTTKVFNFAHPVFITYGAYVAIFLNEFLNKNTPFLIVALFSFITGGLIGVINYLLIIRPLHQRGASPNVHMIATMGAWFVYQYALYIICQVLMKLRGASFLSYPTVEYVDILYIQRALGLNTLPQYIITSTALGLLVILSIHVLLNKTMVGFAMRGIADNQILATLCGIPRDKLIALTWFLTGGITALSGILWVNFSGSTTPEIGLHIVVINFAASFIGGLSSLLVTALASAALALTENIVFLFLSYHLRLQPTIRLAIVFGVVFTILVIRPPLGAGGGLPYRFRIRISREVAKP
ncbi:MAG: branched-chain amino acid ABC transporter permease [Desulfurococcaceae archaeon]